MLTALTIVLLLIAYGLAKLIESAVDLNGFLTWVVGALLFGGAFVLANRIDRTLLAKWRANRENGRETESR